MKIKPYPELKDMEWEVFKNLPIGEKLQFFSYNQEIFDVLFSQQFDREWLDRLYQITNQIRTISKSSKGMEWLSTLLKNRRVMLYFVQPSSRTYLSFVSACNILGLTVSDVRSNETSSEVKGESFADTIRTFSSYFDLIIMRHPVGGSAEQASFILNSSGRPIPIINAGSGKDQHPSQALLDIYTLRRSFESEGGLQDKTIMMVGDLKRGRTVRSLSYLLTNFSNIKLIFSSPTPFKMEDDILQFLTSKNIEFEETTEFRNKLGESDAVYMTRLQDEYQYDDAGNNPTYEGENYRLMADCLKLMKPKSIIMHPLPRRDEIDPKVDNDRRAKYWRQMRNGMWTRCGIISLIFGLEEQILSYR